MSMLEKFNLSAAGEIHAMQFHDGIGALIDDLREVPGYSEMPFTEFAELVQTVLAAHCACLSMARLLEKDSAFDLNAETGGGTTLQCMGAIDSIVTAAIAAAGQKGSETTPS